MQKQKSLLGVRYLIFHKPNKEIPMCPTLSPPHGELPSLFCTTLLLLDSSGSRSRSNAIETFINTEPRHDAEDDGLGFCCDFDSSNDVVPTIHPHFTYNPNWLGLGCLESNPIERVTELSG
jgi:hypothetical protein